MSKRGSTDFCGVLAIDKPSGITSHDVVQAVRRIFKEKRVGHCGTLDPMASGLLLVCVGPATRLSNYLTAKQKSYQARIRFGVATNTDDSDGEVTSVRAVPATVAQPDFAQKFLQGLVGEQLQTPPSFSAIKKAGVQAYKAARRGEELDLAPRKIQVIEASILAVGDDYWDVSFTVSKGTYIRALARDIGRQLGTCAHLAALRRISCGSISISSATALDRLGTLDFIDPIAALGLPVLELDSAQVALVCNGAALSVKPKMTARSASSRDCPANQISLCHSRDSREARGWPQATKRWESTQERQRCASSSDRIILTHNSKLLAIYKNTDNAKIVSEIVIPGGIMIPPIPASCAIGAFDGVHAGHQSLIAAVRADAALRGVKAVVITFDIDPDELFCPGKVQKLFRNSERLEMLRQLDVELIVIPFTAKLAALSWREFLEQVIAAKIHPQSIFVGQNFRFGAKAAGGIEQLRLWAGEHGCSVEAQDLLTVDGEVVSSTQVRRLLQLGDVKAAAQLLTRAFSITGEVNHGAGRGKELGFATANIQQDPKTAQLGSGVYAGYCQVDGQRYKAAISVGEPPTFTRANPDSKSQLIEPHLLNFSGDLYGKSIKLEFIEFLRPMQAFPNQEALIAVVQADIAKAEMLL